jgi:hypothetical protein
MKSANEVIAAIPTYGLTYGGYSETGRIGKDDADRIVQALLCEGFVIVKDNKPTSESGVV